MIVGSIKEDLSLEKRVSITPETAKNIINLGLKICIEHINKVAICVGTHNEESCEFLITLFQNYNKFYL